MDTCLLDNIIPDYMTNMPVSTISGMTRRVGNLWSLLSSHENLSAPIPVHNETIKLTKSVLYAPDPNAPFPAFRTRLPGLKTVFVGGLPDKITEEIVREAFEQCGEIVTIQMNEKKFCHIRFGLEEHAEKALYLHRFRIKIENKDKSSYSGRLHVDYAISNGHDYRCIWYAVQKNPNAPPVPPFSEAELRYLRNQFRNGNFLNIPILTSRVEKKQISESNADTIFSILRSLKHGILRLPNISVYEYELNKAKLIYAVEEVYFQFMDIEKLFEAIKHSRMWNQFTKSQKLNIELWKKQISELKTAYSHTCEMDLSDEEDIEWNEDSPKGNNKRGEEICDKIEDLCKQLDSTLLQVENARTDKIEVMLKNLKISKKFPGIDSNFKKFNRISKRSR